MREKYPVDFYSLVVGLLASAIFLAYLAAQILDAKRKVKADKWLAAVLIGFVVIALQGLYRVFVEVAYVPLLTPVIWGTQSLIIAKAAYHTRQENKALRASRKLEREALSHGGSHGTQHTDSR
jgi:hypothetical protein